MTKQRELAEMIIESEDTGRKIQARLIGDGHWCDHTKGTYFDVLVYEYRLEPKIVKHGRWFTTQFLQEHGASVPYPGTSSVYFEWETEE